jgi:multidrug efflux pump subunit AcrA (membrane-fusion protein)
MVAAIVLVVGLLILYKRHRGEVALEAARESPVVAPSRLHQEGDATLLALDSAAVARIGLRTAALKPASTIPELRLSGEVIPEPERTVLIRAPLAGRLAVPENGRWPRLGDHVAAGTALAQVSDARPLAAPLGGVVTRVGARPGEIVAAGQELLEITDRSHPMVRVTWSHDAGATPRPSLLIAPATGAEPVRARLIGPAPEADPVTRLPAYLYRAESSWPGATPGTPVLGLLAVGKPVAHGVLIPDPAVVQWEGFAWAYLRRAPQRYERVRVPTDRPVAGGWIAGAPFASGDTVVVTGAEQLLSEEFRARVTVGEEAGE